MNVHILDEMLYSNMHSDTPSNAAAELTFALLLASPRQLPQQMASLKKGHWQMGVGQSVSGRLIPIIVRAPKDTEYGLIDHMTGSQTEADFLSPSSKRTPYSEWRQATQQGYLEILETFRTPR